VAPTELCEVVITAPGPEWLKDFSRALVTDGLCASAHNFSPVQSIYRWRGEIHERREGRVSLHTSRSRVPEIVARAKREHPYEVPGVSARPITDGNPDYLAWIEQETMKRPDSTPPTPPEEIQELGRDRKEEISCGQTSAGHGGSSEAWRSGGPQVGTKIAGTGDGGAWQA